MLVGTGLTREVNELDVLREVKLHVALDKLDRGNAGVAQDASRLAAVGADDLLDLGSVDVGTLAHLNREIEDRRRLAQAAAKDLVELGQHLLLLGTKLLERGTLRSHLSQDRGVLAKEGREQGIHLRSVLVAGGVRHEGLGDGAPLLHDVAAEDELAAVIDRSEHELGDLAVIPRLIRGVNHVLEAGVATLELVIELHVILGELKVIDVEVGKDLGTQDVERREHPAAARVALASHGLGGLERHAEGVLVVACLPAIDAGLDHAERGDGVARHAVGTHAREVIRELVDGREVEFLGSHASSLG